ncbi:hypothetical protein BVX98_05455 [bacterium F11]|nr:hypothetical protein BVX98_05455 [bacterium F11]
MRSQKERRKKRRWQVAVLVRCSLPKFEHEVFELEMWAKDVNEKGMKLEWSRGLNVSQLHKEGPATEVHSIRFDDVSFVKGEYIKIQDLFYDDDGDSPFIEGKVLWARRGADSWFLGIQFDDPKKQPKALLGAFKDFLNVVKQPNDFLEKASRKK